MIGIDGGQSSRRSRTGRGYRSSIGPFLALAVALPCAAAPPSGPVQNVAPQQAVDPPKTENPLYHPRHLKATGSRAEEPGLSPDVLLLELRELHSSLKHDRALVVADELVRVAPDHPLAHYNRACVLARLRRTTMAMDALERAIDCGWRRVTHTLVDFDLGPIRRHPRFGELIATMRRLAREERIVPGPLRHDPLPPLIEELEAELPSILHRYRVPGATVSLIRDGAVVWSGAGGEYRSGGGEPMDRDTRFRVAAPVDLLAIVASFREHDAQRLDLRDAVQFALETNGSPSRTASRPPRLAPGAVTVRRLGPVGGAASRPPGLPDEGVRPLPSLLRSLVEESSGMGFQRYCRVEILEPLGVSGDVIGPTVPSDRLAVAHSVFGTPLDPELDEPDGGRSMVASAEEIARVIAILMRGESEGTDSEKLPRRLAELARLDGEVGGALGVPLRLEENADGSCLELAEERGGTGCLARWYPAERCGVVILYNAETGDEAARRLAHLALGGG